MISIIISLLVGGLVGYSSYEGAGPVWSTILGVFISMVTFILFGLGLRKRLMTVVNTANDHVQKAQEEAMRMMNRFQAQPGGSQKMMETKLDKVMEKGVREALQAMDAAQPLYKWTPLAERTMNTMKMQLNYQIKDWDEVDRLMSKIVVLEPMTLAMKLARAYQRKDENLDKMCKKGVKQFKGDKAVMIVSLYCWILVKRQEADKALELLAELKEKTNNEVIARNWQCLANNKASQFSNAGLGNEWYALHLEKPRAAKAGKGQMRNHPLTKGKRRYF